MTYIDDRCQGTGMLALYPYVLEIDRSNEDRSIYGGTCPECGVVMALSRGMTMPLHFVDGDNAVAIFPKSGENKEADTESKVESREAQNNISEMEDTTAIRIDGCARCGKTHHIRKSHIKKFQRPIREGGTRETRRTWTHWLLCPESGDPVLLIYEIANR